MPDADFTRIQIVARAIIGRWSESPVASDWTTFMHVDGSLLTGFAAS
jgi:hypothetical protein